MTTVARANGMIQSFTTVYLPFDMHQEARRLGINVSKVTRTALEKEIGRRNRGRVSA